MTQDKKIIELAKAVDTNRGEFTKLNEYVSAKPFGDTGHVMLECGFPGYEGQVLIARSALSTLGAVLQLLGEARNK